MFFVTHPGPCFAPAPQETAAGPRSCSRIRCLSNEEIQLYGHFWFPWFGQHSSLLLAERDGLRVVEVGQVRPQEEPARALPGVEPFVLAIRTLKEHKPCGSELQLNH